MNSHFLLKVKNSAKRGRTKLFLVLLSYFERATGTTITFRTHPLYSKDIAGVADALIEAPRCAIILQGAVMKKYDFTLETVRIYKKVYPTLTIIVSTWEDEEATYIELLRNAGAKIVLSKKPEYWGTWNINLQIVSTRNGIAFAKELGIPYTIKSRTDQRMYERNILETLHNLVSYFPPAQWSGLNKRLVICHLAYKYYDGYFPDMFMFGDTDDLHEYWNTQLLKKEDHFNGEFFSELYLTSSFRQRKGWPGADSIESVWDTYRDCVILMDWNDIDLLWPKYEYFWEQPYTRKERYKEVNPNQKFINRSFNDWFNIFSNSENKVISALQKDGFQHYQEAVRLSDYQRNHE